MEVVLLEAEGEAQLVSDFSGWLNVTMAVACFLYTPPADPESEELAQSIQIIPCIAGTSGTVGAFVAPSSAP